MLRTAKLEAYNRAEMGLGGEHSSLNDLAPHWRSECWCDFQISAWFLISLHLARSCCYLYKSRPRPGDFQFWYCQNPDQILVDWHLENLTIGILAQIKVKSQFMRSNRGV